LYSMSNLKGHYSNFVLPFFQPICPLYAQISTRWARCGPRRSLVRSYGAYYTDEDARYVPDDETVAVKTVGDVVTLVFVVLVSGRTADGTTGGLPLGRVINSLSH
jgi:hypothetical protein